MSAINTASSAAEDEVLSSFKNVTLKDSAPFTMIDSCESLRDLLDTLENLPTNPPSLYLDLEGIKLSRHGSISLIQLFLLPQNHAYLIDVHLLRHKAFSTLGTDGKKSLKTILEAEGIPKVFFDVRNDSDALYSHFGIMLQGVEDIQLMELAARKFNRRYVNGLARCIKEDVPMKPSERQAWLALKEKGLNMFAPERGGSHAVFNERPLPEEIGLYCVQDVRFLPVLWSCYQKKMGPNWPSRLKIETNKRILESQKKSYEPHGASKKYGPDGWTG